MPGELKQGAWKTYVSGGGYVILGVATLGVVGTSFGKLDSGSADVQALLADQQRVALALLGLATLGVTTWQVVAVLRQREPKLNLATAVAPLAAGIWMFTQVWVDTDKNTVDAVASAKKVRGGLITVGILLVLSGLANAGLQYQQRRSPGPDGWWNMGRPAPK